MNRSSAILITALALPSLVSLTAAAGVSSVSEPASQSIIIHCGKLIDGLSDTLLGARRVRIDKGVITAVDNTSGAVAAEPDIDLQDYTCLPGLINTHVHFDANPEDAADYGIYARRSTRDNLELILQNAEITLKSGFTTVRHVGAWFPDAVATAKALIDEGLAQGPNIQTAGPYLTIPGGGGDLTFPEIPPENIPAESQQGIASTPEDFAQRAQTAVDKGAEFLKVIASGAVFSMGTAPGAPEMHQDDIAAVVAVAKTNGIKVTAHVHSDQSGRDAILAGVDSLEHASLLSDKTIRLAAEHNVAFSMDVYNGTYTDTTGRELGYPEVFIARNMATTEAQRSVFRKAVKAGVTLLYGTDAGVLPHDMGGWQFEIMVEQGMAPMKAIQSATSVAAHHMGMGQEVGAISPGLQADIIAVRGNPLEDVSLLRDVPVVLKDGVLIKAP
jgi:imidazolonepropionase-like amidohydrolase